LKKDGSKRIRPKRWYVWHAFKASEQSLLSNKKSQSTQEMGDLARFSRRQIDEGDRRFGLVYLKPRKELDEREGRLACLLSK